jgi:hypothetical protein
VVTVSVNAAVSAPTVMVQSTMFAARPGAWRSQGP